ncbi:DUF3102 domain-containing protein [Aureimonas sp. N4]|uniref:DUF3102 domain-containing protein n=1 Tax=Aureimonas sp. N4 TaxID=1638165 RepID=UPI0007834F01|nr:DUF3102 domain-containing protein [Aureimonas sp. N4]
MAKSTKVVGLLDRGAAAARFDYALIPDAGARKFLQAAAKELRKGLVSLTEAMCVVGEKLIECKPKVPHGIWTMWLVSETGMSETWSRGCMAMYARFGTMPALFAELDFALAPTSILRLASAPDAAVEDVLDRVRDGEKLTVVAVEDVIDVHLNRAREAKRLAEPTGPEKVLRGRKAAMRSLKELSDRGHSELISAVVDRLAGVLSQVQRAQEMASTARPVSKKTLEKEVRDDAQWLVDALEQLSQRSAVSSTHLVHRTFLSREVHEPGPWADVAGVLADIASAIAWEKLPASKLPAFLERAETALRAVLDE